MGTTAQSYCRNVHILLADAYYARVKAMMQFFLTRLFLLLMSLSVFQLGNAAKGPPSPPTQTQASWGGSDNRILILHSVSNQPVHTLEVGQTYKLKIKIDGITEIRNNPNAQWSWMNGLYDGLYGGRQLMSFRVDTAVDSFAWVTSPSGDLIWTFTLLDSPDIYERGTVKVLVQYKIGDDERMAEKYYEIYDHTPDYGLAVNDGAPVKVSNLYFGHMGDRMSEQDLESLSQDMTDSFLYATKGYVGVNFIYNGRVSFPAEGSVSSGLTHNYTSWWNSKNHNLAGTSLLPVNLNSVTDAELVKTFYYRDHPSSATLDILNNSPYGLTTAEVPIGWSVAPSKVLCGVDSYHPYSENVGGTLRYGKSTDIAWGKRHHQVTTCLHEFGHTHGLSHPLNTYIPSGSLWTVRHHNSFEFMVNIMHQGAHINGPFIDLFYIDADIVKLAGTSPITAPILPVPRLIKSPDPIAGPTVVLEGIKESGAGIVINGVQHITNGDAASNWSVVMSADVGVNRYLISQTILVNGSWRQSKDNVFITRRLGTSEVPGTVPAVALTKQWKNDKQVKFDIDAQAAGGLALVNWWVERLTTSGYKVVQYAGHNRQVEGAANVSVTHTYNFTGDGTYRIKARAYAYNVAPSAIEMLEFVVGDGAAINVDPSRSVLSRIKKNTIQKKSYSPVLKKAK